MEVGHKAILRRQMVIMCKMRALFVGCAWRESVGCLAGQCVRADKDVVSHICMFVNEMELPLRVKHSSLISVARTLKTASDSNHLFRESH